jgi:CRISPR system Cascade subunit CasA
MWETTLSPAVRLLFCEATGLADEECRNWLSFVAATHDLGKCTPEFQRKSEPLADRLRAVGILSRAHAASNPPKPHGLLGTAISEAPLRQGSV